MRNGEYEYLPAVQQIIDRIEAGSDNEEMKKWAKDTLMIIDDNMRGNPGYSIQAEMQIKGLTDMSDEMLIETVQKEYDRYIEDNQDVIIGTA